MTATQTTLDSTQSRTLLVITAFVTFILLGLPAGMLGVAWPSIRDGFQVSQESVGALLLASRLGYLLSSSLSGPAATRLGTGGLLLLGAGSFCLGLVGYAVAPTWLLMVLVGGLVGAGGGALDAGMNAFFALNFGPRLMNWLHASFGVGATLGPALLTVILVNGGSWRLGYWMVAGALAGLTVFYGFILSRWRTRLPLEEGGQENQAHGGVSLARLGVLLSILIFLMSAGLEGATGQWSFSLFTESRGVSVATAGMWVSIYWGAYTVGRMIFGLIADRTPIVPALRGCLALVGVGALLLWWNPVNLVGFLGVALMGLALAPVFPLLVTATPARFGRARAQNLIGVQVAAASLGIGLLPGAAGALAERLGLEIVGPFLFLAALVLFALHEALERRRPASGKEIAR